MTDDDSAGNGQFRLSVALQTTGTTILVVTSFSTSATGSVALTVTGPSLVTFAVLPNPTTITSQVTISTTRPTTTTTRSTMSITSSTTSTTRPTTTTTRSTMSITSSTTSTTRPTTTTTRSTMSITSSTTSTTRPITSTYFTVLSNNSAFFTRPGGYGDYFYVAIRVIVSSNGNFSFQSNSTIDTYGCLYNNAFTSTTPSANLIARDDDSAGGRQFLLTAALQSTGTTILILTTYSSSATGNMTVGVTGPSAVSFSLYPNPTSITTQPTTSPRPIASTYSTVLSSTSATFTRPGSSGNYFYVAIRIMVSSSGTFIFQSNSTIDTYGYLYNNSFSPSVPNTNLLTADDDGAGNAQFRLTAALKPTVAVVLVVTSYSPNATGSVIITVTGPSAVNFMLASDPTRDAIQATLGIRPEKKVDEVARAKTREYYCTSRHLL